MRFSVKKCAKAFIVIGMISLGLCVIFNKKTDFSPTLTKVQMLQHFGFANISKPQLHSRVERSSILDRNLTVLKLFKKNELRLDDIMISVKTTEQNHRTRLKILIDTWINNARNQTYIFTDNEDDWLKNLLPENHVINTQCPQDHSRKSLCCKMATEFDTFIMLRKKWFCHMDDDTYVNIPQLMSLLMKYNHTSDWYLGKPSLQHPIEILDRQHPGQMLAFWFATGGAGFCISRALALKMLPHAGGGRLMRIGELIRLPDDCTVGYIINSMLRKELTVIPEFHSHLEPLWKIGVRNLKEQITVSYKVAENKINVVRLPEFSEKSDPTRFWAVHCHLNPMTKECLGHR